MYTNFFYQLRQEGIRFLSRMDDSGGSLICWTGQFQPFRLLLLGAGYSHQKASHYDQYDPAFQKYFQGVETRKPWWTKSPNGWKITAQNVFRGRTQCPLEKLGLPTGKAESRFGERCTQDSPHHGGNKWTVQVGLLLWVFRISPGESASAASLMDSQP